jgi:hypothetical protein
MGLNHHLVKEITLRALKRADIETHTCGHDASEHHVSAALWASRAVQVDVVRQEIGFLHDAFPHRGGGSATEINLIAANKKYSGKQLYLGAINWPWSQRIISLDCRGSPSFTAVLS